MGIQERRERERQFRRSAVLDAARGLVRENGFAGTTTRQIAERCELSEATLFWYFKSKDEIFVSLLFEAIDFTANGLEKIGALNLEPEKMLFRLWHFFAELREEHPEYYFVFTYLAHPRSIASINEDVREELARRSGDNFRLLAELLRSIIGAENCRQAADLIWSAFVGLMVLRDSRENLGARAHPHESELDNQIRLMIDGIGAHFPGKGPA